MANPEITNNNTLKVPVFNGLFEDATLSFAGAITHAAGVIMARVVAAAGAVTADVGNTGDGTVTAFALAAGGPPKPGDWNLEVVTAVTNGGELKLEDPDGNIVDQPFVMTVGAGAVTIFTAAGMTLTVTDGSTDFIVGDKFALTVTDAGQKWVPYVEGAVDGSGDPSGILPADVTATGSGDLLRRMLVGGEVAENALSIKAGGTIGDDVKQSLRDFGILVVEAAVIDELDNQ